jgi:aldose sugar dehydrogenase
MRRVAALPLIVALLASPAARAQTPVLSSGDVPVEQGLRQVPVVQGLEHPWGMTWLPDGSILVTERPGRLRLVKNGMLDPVPVPGLPEIAAIGQGGLMDVVAHPDFAANRFVYFTYAHGTREANRTRIARATFDGKTLANWQLLYEVPQAKGGGGHFGSRLIFLPDGTMLISIGDGGNPPNRLDGRFIRENAQDLSSALGKVLRLNADGSVPKDNPFVSRAGAHAAVWSYGHRNVQGLARDPATGFIWTTEHGALGGDELNLTRAGANYGWPAITHSKEYWGPEISKERSRAGMADPALVWQNATAPSGLAVYSADAIPALKGAILSGGLMTQDVRVIRTDAKGAVTGQNALRVGARVRDVRVGPDGFIYVLTDERANARLIRFETAPAQAQPVAGPPRSG